MLRAAAPARAAAALAAQRSRSSTQGSRCGAGSGWQARLLLSAVGGCVCVWGCVLYGRIWWEWQLPWGGVGLLGAASTRREPARMPSSAHAGLESLAAAASTESIAAQAAAQEHMQARRGVGWVRVAGAGALTDGGDSWWELEAPAAPPCRHDATPNSQGT